AEEASRPSLAMKAKPGGYTLERLVDEASLDDLKQEAARILLAEARPITRSWESDPWAQRLEQRETRLQKLAPALPEWGQKHPAGEPHGKSWRWRHDLTKEMGGERTWPVHDPWGRLYSTDEVVERTGLGDFPAWAEQETTRRLQQIYLALARAHLTL